MAPRPDMTTIASAYAGNPQVVSPQPTDNPFAAAQIAASQRAAAAQSFPEWLGAKAALAGNSALAFDKALTQGAMDAVASAGRAIAQPFQQFGAGLFGAAAPKSAYGAARALAPNAMPVGVPDALTREQAQAVAQMSAARSDMAAKGELPSLTQAQAMQAYGEQMRARAAQSPDRPSGMTVGQLAHLSQALGSMPARLTPQQQAQASILSQVQGGQQQLALDRAARASAAAGRPVAGYTPMDDATRNALAEQVTSYLNLLAFGQNSALARGLRMD